MPPLRACLSWYRANRSCKFHNPWWVEVHCQLILLRVCNSFALSLQAQHWPLIPCLQHWYSSCLFMPFSVAALMCVQIHRGFGVVHKGSMEALLSNDPSLYLSGLLPSAQMIQAPPSSAGFLAPWDLWALDSGPGLLKSLWVFLFLASLSISRTCKIKAQFLTSVSPCVNVHHYPRPSVLHTACGKLLLAISSREALRFKECPFSLTGRYTMVWGIALVCWSIPWITNCRINNLYMGRFH